MGEYVANPWKPWNHKSRRRLIVHQAEDGILWIDEDTKYTPNSLQRLSDLGAGRLPRGYQRGKWDRQSVRLTVAELRELADKYAGKERGRG